MTGWISFILVTIASMIMIAESRMIPIKPSKHKLKLTFLYSEEKYVCNLSSRKFKKLYYKVILSLYYKKFLYISFNILSVTIHVKIK